MKREVCFHLFCFLWIHRYSLPTCCALATNILLPHPIFQETSSAGIKNLETFFTYFHCFIFRKNTCRLTWVRLERGLNVTETYFLIFLPWFTSSTVVFFPEGPSTATLQQLFILHVSPVFKRWRFCFNTQYRSQWHKIQLNHYRKPFIWREMIWPPGNLRAWYKFDRRYVEITHC